MDEKKIEGTSSILNIEGLPEAVADLLKSDAIILIQRGRSPDEVRRVVESIRDGFAEMKKMSWQMDNRDRLAQYNQEHPDL